MKHRGLTRLLVVLLSMALLAAAVGSAFVIRTFYDSYGVSPFGEALTIDEVQDFWQALAREQIGTMNQSRIQQMTKAGPEDPEAPNLRLRVFLISDDEKLLMMNNADEDCWHVGELSVAASQSSGMIRLMDENTYLSSREDEWLIETYVAQPLKVRDAYWMIYQLYSHAMLHRLPLIACVVAALLWLILLAWLCARAGCRGAEGPRPCWFDRVPLEILIALAVLACVPGRGLLMELSLPAWMPSWVRMALLGCAGYLLGVALLLTLVSRARCGVLWKHTLLCILTRQLRRLGRFLMTSLPVCWQLAICVTAVLLINVGLLCYGNIAGGFWVFVAFCAVLDGLFLLLALWYGWNLDRIQKAIDWIGAGAEPRRLVNAHMLPKMRHMTEQLGDIGAAIDHAVSERTKSERMKTELISNVSHDLKTPLTSLINYVDLLKRADSEELRGEYIGILDRQAHRLKKLTEDLVEASKASSGALQVELGEVSVEELLRQALAEYEQRFDEDQLELVVAPTEARVRADGKLLWRVLDNLLSNIHKYAMKGSRVYIDVREADGRCRLTFKNMSAARLNVPEEELMERFVRGDQSRNSEGSGLGLGIARSLMDLMNGTFELSVDGDLFKVELSLPAIAPGE